MTGAARDNVSLRCASVSVSAKAAGSRLIVFAVRASACARMSAAGVRLVPSSEIDTGSCATDRDARQRPPQDATYDLLGKEVENVGGIGAGKNPRKSENFFSPDA